MNPGHVTTRKLINRELDESTGTRRHKRMWGPAGVAVVCLIGAAVTLVCRIETRGSALE